LSTTQTNETYFKTALLTYIWSLGYTILTVGHFLSATL